MRSMLWLMVLVGCSSAEPPCTPAKCESGAELRSSRPFDVTELLGATVSLCHNGICASRSVTKDEPFHGALVADGRIQIEGGLQQTGSRTYAYAILRTGDRSLLQDGDIYVLRVTSAAGKVIFETTKHARYEVKQPDSCNPGCTTAWF